MKDDKIVSPSKEESVSNNPSWVDDVIGPDDFEAFEFNLHKNWRDSVLDELRHNLSLFLTVHTRVQSSKNVRLRNQLMLDVQQVANEAPGVLVSLLKKIQNRFKIGPIELVEKYRYLLNSIRNLRQTPIAKQEECPPYRKKRNEREMFECIPDMLMNKARDLILKKNVRFQLEEIEEIKLKLFILQERSAREINEMLEESAQEMTFRYEDDKLDFAVLQEEMSKKVLATNENEKQYNELLQEHEQKARKLRKAIVQLQRAIKEYDTYIGEPMRELKVEEDEIDQAMEWKATVFDPQNERCRQLRFNVELLEAELIERQVEKFRFLHAVRVLQRACRKALERKKSKKRRKKTKGDRGVKRGGKKGRMKK
ncbi:uncharacterized protein LOC129761700 [Toxorhynchites rutilus septentrionalis]|uniref:uncharacterized protein LOC129761700 n=1 Tax=Toxorhynchites rutilus septentrionalis TaxID=329112 RepID=UPI0024789BE9|nr:uncharacterized protein LOC129761700 [Toxorhynchites rutilus septentrionalis]